MKPERNRLQDWIENTLPVVARIGSDPTDNDDMKLQKSLLVLCAFPFMLAGWAWGLMYFFFREPLAGSIPFSYGIFSLLSILYFARTRQYAFFRFSQLLLILLLPFLLMVTLGGFINGSAVVLWALICPLGALLFDNSRHALRWFLAFVGFVLLSGFLQPYVRLTNHLSQTVDVFFFVINLFGVSSLVFLMVSYFVRQKNINKRQFKDQLYEQFARIGKALSNPHRLEIVELLAQGERTVEELATEANLPIANASQHLQVLRAAQLVDVRRNGLYAFYRLSDERVFRVWQALRDLGEVQLAEVNRIVQSFLQDRSPLRSIRAEELLTRMKAGDVVVLDARPELEFRGGHIPEARSIPVDELEARLGELLHKKEIIAYCWGPYCVFADEAVTLLQKNGYRARRLVEGLPDWQALNLPVETVIEKNE